MPDTLRISRRPPATTRRKPWRRFRARGSSGSAPRLEWVPPVPRWSPAEEAPAVEVRAVESLAVGTLAAATTAVVTPAAGAPMVARRHRREAVQSQAGRLLRTRPWLRPGVPL